MDYAPKSVRSGSRSPRRSSRSTSTQPRPRDSASVRADLVDCIVALPGALFFTTGIPVCLWLIDRDKASSGERDRRGETLFIEARQMGNKISRTQIELSS